MYRRSRPAGCTILTMRAVSLIAVSIAALIIGCAGEDDSIYLRDGSGGYITGDYLGQPLPGDEPELFAPGIVNTGMYTRDFTMTPDGNEIYFSLNVGNFNYTAVLVSRRVRGRWTRPEVAGFSSDLALKVAEPFVAPDGKRLYFISDAVPEEVDAGASGEVKKNYDIWAVDRVGDGWGEPYRLEGPFNTPDNEFFPTVTRGGNLYFCRAEPETGIHYIYRSRLVDGEYQEVEKLPGEVNSGRTMFNATISPGEDFMIVPVFGRQDGVGGVDYYVSFRSADDVWTGPFNMGDLINTAGSQEYSANLSPDGKYLFFMSWRMAEREEPLNYADILAGMDQPEQGNTGIYWMKSDIIGRLREEAAAGATRGEGGQS
ncbi:MAG TPA: hypothetical protein VLA34_02770 [Candidatus Krumholzibacterium sp.]|nr:hypothetical protein [Candidatus Krumholzibacterium sp.]